MFNVAPKFLATVVVAVALSACGGVDNALDVGMTAPSLKTKTLADVGGDFARITSYRFPDERMYKYSIDDALASGKPVVLEFATPGHCTVCDVQLQVMKGLLDKYQGDVLFLHMDQYENPEAFRAFKVMGDPWTFVIDRNRVVKYRQAGRVLYQEMDSIIGKIVEKKAS